MKTGFRQLCQKNCGRLPMKKSTKERNLSEIQERTARCFGVNPGKHVFSGKLVCGLCGAPFYRTTRKGKNHKIHEWKCKKTYLEQGRKKEEKPGGCANIHLEEENCFFF